MKYSEKLKDPRWLDRREQILFRDSKTCQRCFSEDDILQVHHIQYHKGYEPWDYEDDDLITLCNFCHRAVGTTTEEKEIRNPWLQYERAKKELSPLLSACSYSAEINALTNRLCL